MERIEVLDHGYVLLVETWGSDERIIEAARQSTQKGFEGWGVEETCAKCNGSGTNEPENGPGSLCKVCGGRKVAVNKAGDEKLLRYLWVNNHSTPFEMAGLIIEAQAPIFVLREWHRHRVPFSYSEASARYAPLPALDFVPTRERVLRGGGHLTKQAGSVVDQWLARLEAKYASDEEFYQWGLAGGIPKELARVGMPVGHYSKMRASSNLRGWMNFLALRDDAKAQHEIQVYARAVREMLAEKFPRSMALFAEGRK